MPAKLDRCVKDVKAKGGADNPWAVCNASIDEVSDATGIILPTTESHNPLDIVFGREVPETVSVPSGASAISIGGKRKIDEIHVENTKNGKHKMEAMSNNVLKQILETKLDECPCKKHNKSKA